MTLDIILYLKNLIFQSTQPSQAVTEEEVAEPEDIMISIHTAFAGCDPPLAIAAASIV